MSAARSAPVLMMSRGLVACAMQTSPRLFWGCVSRCVECPCVAFPTHSSGTFPCARCRCALPVHMWRRDQRATSQWKAGGPLSPALSSEYPTAPVPSGCRSPAGRTFAASTLQPWPLKGFLEPRTGISTKRSVGELGLIFLVGFYEQFSHQQEAPEASHQASGLGFEW